jgi:hypothetical protein
MDLNGIAAIITATGGALATVITQLATYYSNRHKLEDVQREAASLKADHARLAQDLGRATRNLQDQLGTIDDRTGSTQRLMEGVALAQGNTPLPQPIQPTPRLSETPKVSPIPQGSQPGFKR